MWRFDQQKLPSDRSFGITIAGALALLAMWSMSRGSLLWAAVLALTGGLALFVALTRPAALRPLNRIWTNVGVILHAVVNPLVLGLIFYFLITPIGIFMRLRGRDLMKLRRSTHTRSYWIHRTPPGPAPHSLGNQF